MPYNSSTGIIIAPLNINSGGDIQQAVNYSSGDLGDCIVNGTINRWAKWKPEINSKVSPLSLAERQANMFGFTLTKFTSFSSLASSYASQWVYNQPTTISSSSRARMYDFTNVSDITSTGYNKNAACFFDHGGFPTSYVNDDTLGEAIFYAYWNTGNNLPAGSLALTDFLVNNAALSTLYFGMVFYDTWSEIYYIVTTSTTVGADVSSSYSRLKIYATNSSNTPSFPSGLNGHHFMCYPVLSKRAYSTALATSLTDSTDYLVALPTSPFSFDIIGASSSVWITISDAEATWGVRATLMASFVVGMMSSGGGATTISDAYFRVYGVSSDGSMDTSNELTTGGEYIGGAIDSTVPTTRQIIRQYRPNPRPNYIRIYVYRSNDPTIYANAWVKVTEGEL